jgi:hypothetical protein
MYIKYIKKYTQFKPKHLFLTDPEKELPVFIGVIELITCKAIFHVFCATLHFVSREK